VENVTGLLARGLEQVLGDLAAVGYDAQWHCISAAHVGAPHRRDRVWIVAYPNGSREPQSGWGELTERGWAQHSSEALADSSIGGRNEGNSDSRGDGEGASSQEERRGPTVSSWWESEPDVGRVAHGVPARSYRLGGLGNAVVPQIPEIIGRAIMTAHNSCEQL
jgi:DNA (cytosine-5)-methyltransferase 1